ncbi:MAG: methyl-accepting chemotaxis protein [Planctomycetota bacterium]|jgi:methyl-accepting chemotaxis protein
MKTATSPADRLATTKSTAIPMPRRRQYIVDPAFQLGVIVKFMMLQLVTLTVLAGFMFGPSVWALHSQGKNNQEIIASAQQMLALDARFWPAFFVVVAISLVFAILITHQIAGPLYRFRVVLEELKNGVISKKFKLRKRDMLMNHAGLLNEALDSMRKDAQAMNDIRGELSKISDGLRQSGDLDQANSIVDVVHKMSAQRKKML